jgi:hypothetical protein
MKPMPKGPWHWLEIIATGALAHVCRTNEIDAFPDEADSRQDVRLSVQKNLLNWFEKERPLGQIIVEIPQLYAWLTFRVGQDGRISHLCWKAPAADSDEWIGHLNVVEEIAKSGSEVFPVSSAPDPITKLRFKEEVARALEMGGDKKTGA